MKVSFNGFHPLCFYVCKIFNITLHEVNLRNRKIPYYLGPIRQSDRL